MNKDLSISEKLGCDKYAIESCILVKASVASISTMMQQYFELEIQSHCTIADYLDTKKTAWQEVERQRQIRTLRPKKSFPPIRWGVPFWQYCNHQWTVLPLSGQEDSIAFALALLLNTDTIAFHRSRYASFNEFRVFRGDQLIERYVFGFECGELINNLNWDLRLEVEFDNWRIYDHYFKSLIRKVTATQIRSAFLSRENNHDEKGFLDACLKYYKAYIPQLEETPYHYHYDEPSADFNQWNAIAARMDLLIVPDNWKYIDCKVPEHVL